MCKVDWASTSVEKILVSSIEDLWVPEAGASDYYIENWVWGWSRLEFPDPTLLNGPLSVKRKPRSRTKRKNRKPQKK